MRQRVAGDGPRTDQNNDSFLVAQVVAFLLSATLGRRSVCLGPGLVAVCSFPVLGVGCRSRVPWPLPLWLVAAPVFWFRLLYWLSWERATSQEPIPSFHCPCGPLSGIPWYVGSTGASISRAYSYAGTYRFLLPSLKLRRAFHPPAEAGGRTSTCRAGSPWRFTFPSISLSSLLFASIVATHVWRPMSHFTGMISPRAISEVAESLDVRGQFLGTHVCKVSLGVGKNPRPTRTMSGSCRDSPMKK